MSTPHDEQPQAVKHDPRKNHLFISSTILVAVGFLIAVLYFAVTSINVSKVPSALIGKQAADFRLEFVEGEEFIPEALGPGLTLNDMRGKYVVLNFWASWCVSCRSEARELEAFWQSIDRKQTLVVGIAIQDKSSDALEFAKNYGKTYPLVIDEPGSTAIEYGVSGVPETFIIDPNGIIVGKETGPVTKKRLLEIFQELGV